MVTFFFEPEAVPLFLAVLETDDCFERETSSSEDSTDL
jgi:hypothetical protein